MKARVKSTFTFDVYVNGEYSNELSFISGNAMTFKQAVTLAKKKLHNLSAVHAQIFLAAGSLAVADVTMFNYEIMVNDYDTTPAETYAVCWGDEYKEEDGENNAIATTTSESDAKEIAESESETNSCTMSVIRKSDRKVIATYNNTPETPNPDNTTATMNANETKQLTASILDELNARKCRGTWDNAVNAYAVELVESLDNWDKQPESVAELRKMMLNGANDWSAYSWGGSSLIYNWDIAERLCTPSELRRLTRKDGTLNTEPRGVHLLDHQTRALYQAANRVANIAAKYFNV